MFWCGCAALLIVVAWVIFKLYCQKDPLRKYVWPHEAKHVPLPYKDLKFDAESQFTNQDGEVLVTYESKPRFRAGNAMVDPSRPRGVLLVVPTLGSHMQRYAVLANVGSDLGFATYGLDHAGFGKSGTSHAIRDFDNLVRDVLDFAGRVKELHPDTSLFLVGHGFGGTIAALCVYQDPHMFAGVIYIAPIFQPIWTSFQQALIRKLGSRFPEMTLGNVCWPAPDITSPNKAVEAQNLEDPLYCKGPISLGTALQILELSEAARACIPRTKTSLFLQEGGRDLVSVGAAQCLSQSRAAIKDYFVSQFLWHDLLASYQGAELSATLLDWAQERLRTLSLFNSLN